MLTAFDHTKTHDAPPNSLVEITSDCRSLGAPHSRTLATPLSATRLAEREQESEDVGFKK